MIRECSGTDDALVREWEGEYVPCDCGLIFDDIERAVVYPHVPIPDKGLDFSDGVWVRETLG